MQILSTLRYTTVGIVVVALVASLPVVLADLAKRRRDGGS